LLSTHRQANVTSGQFDHSTTRKRELERPGDVR
jgi:hypothetical protein